MKIVKHLILLEVIVFIAIVVSLDLNKNLIGTGLIVLFFIIFAFDYKKTRFSKY